MAGWNDSEEREAGWAGRPTQDRSGGRVGVAAPETWRAPRVTLVRPALDAGREQARETRRAAGAGAFSAARQSVREERTWETLHGRAADWNEGRTREPAARGGNHGTGLCGPAYGMNEG